MTAWNLALFSLTSASVLLSQQRPNRATDLYTVQQEIELGHREAALLLQQLPVLRTSQWTSYVGSVAAKLVNDADTRFNYHIFVYDDRKGVPLDIGLSIPRNPIRLNPYEAIVLPGGPIFCPLSLFLNSRDESTFAFDLAHAIAHVNFRHCTRLATLSEVLDTAAAQNTARDVDFSSSAEFTTRMGLLRFSRKFELQADAFATTATLGAGFDPRSVLTHLLEQGETEHASYEYLASDHPSTRARVNVIESKLKSPDAAQGAHVDSNEYTKLKAEISRSVQ